MSQSINRLTQTTFEQIEQKLKTKELHYYNFYNNDIRYTLQQTSRWYSKHSNDTITNFQPLHSLYLDIEVYNNNQGMDEEIIDNGSNPINIVTIYDDQEQIFHTYLLLFPNNFETFGLTSNMSQEDYVKFIEDRQTYYINELKKREYVGNEYISDIKGLNLHIYNDEKSLLLDLWKHIHECDPDILTSWNGDNFDYWYLYNRLRTLFGDEQAPKIMSKFGKITINSKRVQFCEYTVADLLYFYKPRDENG